jgi:hypothetical protein
MAQKKVQINDVIVILKNVLNAIANPSYVDKTANQIRAQVTGSLTTVTTVTTATGLTNIDSYQGKLLMIASNRNAWYNTCRRLIT